MIANPIDPQREALQKVANAELIALCPSGSVTERYERGTGFVVMNLRTRKEAIFFPDKTSEPVDPDSWDLWLWDKKENDHKPRKFDVSMAHAAEWLRN
ncbi:MAG: hypothetical protein MUD05_07770 [Candidatus Nanopelagicales bacterium]|jgi:hypothetical protein|nr:hypothetical protein [Candidatus Nanopelagicales bacterium]